MSATKPIGIVGIGQPGYQPQSDKALPEFVHTAAREALEDAGIDRANVENVVACASDLEDGRAISSMTTAAPGGSYEKDFVKTTDSGIHAVELAMLRMESGLFDSTLVLSWGKGSEADLKESVRLEGEPFVHRSSGLGHQSGHAIEASAYYDAHPEPDAAASWLVEHDTKNGVANPRVSGCEVMKSKEVTKSPVVSWPLRQAHVPEDSDGATALVLCTPTFIKETDIKTDPVWVRGVGRQTASYNAGNRQLGSLTAAQRAAERAYQEADLDSPKSQIDVAELEGMSAFHELMILEALKLVDEKPNVSELKQAFAEAETELNPSGGTLAANPLTGAGLAAVAAAARHIRQDSTETRGVAHSTGGFTDQVQAVTVLEGE